MEPFLGSILLVPYNFAPERWAPCNGALLSITRNTALYSLLGTTFGGDGKTTFALPTLVPPADGMHYIIAMEGVYPTRP
jgi:microcystin-dependent protein